MDCSEKIHSFVKENPGLSKNRCAYRVWHNNNFQQAISFDFWLKRVEVMIAAGKLRQEENKLYPITLVPNSLSELDLEDLNDF